MPTSFFDKIKLFKGAEIQPGRTTAEHTEEEKKLPLGERLLKGHWLFLAVTAIVIALFLTARPSRSLSALVAGAVAPADVTAPFDLLIEDPEVTDLKKEEAAAAVLPVYSFDANVFANTEDKVRLLFAEGRGWTARYPGNHTTDELRTLLLDKLSIDIELQDLALLVRLKFPAELEEVLVGLSAKIFSQGIILSKNLFIHGEAEHGLTLHDLLGAERTVRVGDILDIGESERRCVDELEKIEIPARSRTLLSNLGQLFLTANVTYNKIETEKRKAQARAEVGMVTYTVKKDRVIVRKGDEVTADTLKVLDEYNRRILRRSSWLPNFVGSLLLYLFLFSTLWHYLQTVFKPQPAERQFRMAGTALVGSLVLYKVFLALAVTISGAVTSPALSRLETYHYAFPLQAGTLIFAFLVPDPMALLYIILNSLTVGILLGGDFLLTIFSLIGGLAAVYGVKYYKKRYRAATLRVGFIILPAVNAFVILAFHLIERSADIALFSSEVAMGLLGGAASAVLAFLLLPLVETAFGFVTGSKLLELTNSDLPIFRQLSLEAPGSYHHSLIVATLAEKAAEELGLDAQLAKAGALYHDIGKSKMPEYFIENRSREFDLHKDLAPSMSTLVIKNHVKEGVELARKLKLPRPLRDIIEQHHGSSLVRFFYAKAKQTTDPEQQTVGEESYRYAGPAPQTKEAGLVMLADSIEAASRSLKFPTKDNLKRVITDIINSTLQDGQLDGCDFSLRELRSVAASFLTILFAIYHPRVEYPGFGFNGRKPKQTTPARKKDNDRDHQPPEKVPDPDEGV
ncbi:MAG: HDIG domain-containing protein [Candidatus Aminicenantes bacterium]|nr:HDIG domain-containing protein [Candidatus Aminicenantes bacterium]